MSVFILSQERVHLFNLDAVNNVIPWSSVYRRCIIHLFKPLLRGMFVSALNSIWLNRGLLIIKLNSYFPNSNGMIFFFLRMAFLILKPSSTSCFYSLLQLCFLSVCLLSLDITVGLSARISLH